jgi:hypothetical protein
MFQRRNVKSQIEKDRNLSKPAGGREPGIQDFTTAGNSLARRKPDRFL